MVRVFSEGELKNMNSSSDNYFDKAIICDKISFSYANENSPNAKKNVVLDIDLDINKGEYITLVGKNGSGKSTLAKLLNSILKPQYGLVLIYGMDTQNDKFTWEIRSKVGMVFQNPDNQIVGSTIEEDIAFGPENLKVTSKEIRNRVEKALVISGLEEHSYKEPHLLSGGQKQKVAVAGILAMEPECIILDEATSMLDYSSKKSIMDIIHNLNKKNKITIIHITHDMEDAVFADKILVFDNGRIVRRGTPKEVFKEVDYLKKIGLGAPFITELMHELNQENMKLPEGIVDVDEAYEVITDFITQGGKNVNTG